MANYGIFNLSPMWLIGPVKRPASSLMTQWIFFGRGVLKAEFSLQLTRQGMRFLEIILLESPMSFSPSETAYSKLAHWLSGSAN